MLRSQTELSANMMRFQSADPIADARAFCKELNTCIGTCRVSDKTGNRAIVLGTTPGNSMRLMKKEIMKSKVAMTRLSVFTDIPTNVTEHALFVIIFDKG